MITLSCAYCIQSIKIDKLLNNLDYNCLFQLSNKLEDKEKFEEGATFSPRQTEETETQS